MVGLVLGGGGARGYGHIGVLKYLDEIDLEPDLVVATSFGSLVGALYAAGLSGTDIAEVAARIEVLDKYALFFPSPTRTGLVSGRNIYKFLEKHLNNRQIKDCRMKFCAVAVDLDSWEEVLLTEGRLVDAVYASISIPVILAPRKINGRLLIDGGVVAPLPIRSARRLGAERIIAVNVLPREGRPREDYTIPGLFIRSFDIMTSVLIDHQLEELGDGVFIDIDPGIRADQFEQAGAAIAEGYRVAKNTDFSKIYP